jgi:anti-repressor protein
MNNVAQIIVPINDSQIGDDNVKTVDARDLHKFLGSKQQFSNWIRKRINEYGFVEGVDYLINKIIYQVKSGAKYRLEYLITIDMAKELGMVEKTEKGREVRRYFIDCEKTMRKLSDSLIMQFNRAVLEFEKFSDMASNAGKTLSIVGKQLKPQAKDRVSSLKDRIQPHLFVVDDKDDDENEGGESA